MITDKLFQRVLDAHGGTDAWNSVDTIKISVRCGGMALAMRFQAGAYAQYEAVIRTKEPWVSFTPFKGQTGIFTPNRVWIQDKAGNIIKERLNPRHFFPSLRRSLIWDSLDVLYFGGYAIWNYLCAPFFFTQPGFEVTEISPWLEKNEHRERFQVRFPESFHTHCATQTFHVDAKGYIRRHDYTAEVIGNYAMAAHYCDDHKTVEGIVFPGRRRVYPRRPDGTARPFPTLIWIDIDRIDLEKKKC